MLTFTLVIACLVATIGAQNLTDDQVNVVINDLAEVAHESWELGARTQALLEWSTPSFSVLTLQQSIPPSSSAPSSLQDVLNIAASVVANRSSVNHNQTGPQPLIAGDGAAGDPASLGVAVLIANWTGQANSSFDYAGAAGDQLQYLLQNVPRTSEGAISQRVSQVQLWADFIYMAPPFIAYYGAITGNKTLMTEGYTQISLYRDQLRTQLSSPSNAALWKHIVMGSGTDEGHWSTGNGWAAAGMLRVHGTLANSQWSGDSDVKSMISDLGNWVDEILNGMYNYQQPSGLFLNYADQSASSSFEDAASTALIAASVYRQALISGSHAHLPNAERARKALSASSSNSTNHADFTSNSVNFTHFTPTGFVTPVVNPENWNEELIITTSTSSSSTNSSAATNGTSDVSTTGSPESEAFVLEMQAAWRDWVDAGSVGANAAIRTIGGLDGCRGMVVGAVGMIVALNMMGAV